MAITFGIIPGLEAPGLGLQGIKKIQMRKPITIACYKNGVCFDFFLVLAIFFFFFFLVNFLFIFF